MTTDRDVEWVRVGEGDAAASILVVGPDPASRGRCADPLRAAGFRVLEAGGPPDAGDALAGLRPTAIVTAADEVAALRSDAWLAGVPLLVVAGPEAPDSAFAGLAPGVDDVLPPGSSAAETVFRVRALVGAAQARLELSRVRSVTADRAHTWMLLFEQSQTIAQAQDHEAMVEAIIDAATQLTRTRRVALFIPDDASRVLAMASAVGFPPDAAPRESIPLHADHPVAHAHRTGRTTRGTVDDDGDDPDPAACADGWAALPLRAAGRTSGVLHLADRADRGPLAEWELECLDLLAHVAGAAIDEHRASEARDAAHESIVVALATLAEYRDNETGRHVERVTRFSLLLAESLRAGSRYRDRIDAEFLVDLRRAAPLHDIGKVAIPDGILLKPGRLDEDEIAVIRTHAVIGRDALRAVRLRSPGVSFLAMAEDIAAGHHEWFDGTGYPGRIAGEAIPLAARIVAIADVYDAVTSRRVYKDAMPPEAAARIVVEGAGRQFDPVVAEAFLRCRDEFARLAAALTDDPGGPVAGATGVDVAAPAVPRRAAG
ncbi:MAG: HD-GYP domain-containing protein [Planctomycetota bacterium]